MTAAAAEENSGMLRDGQILCCSQAELLLMKALWRLQELSFKMVASWQNVGIK